MRYLGGFLVGAALLIGGFAFDWHILTAFSGAYLALVVEDALRAFKDSLRPATKAERRLARAVESAVAQRTLTIDRNTGEHAA